jgi:8-oxo-dGTP diphosphatase
MLMINVFNEREFLGICSRLGVIPHTEDVAIEYRTGSYFRNVKHSVEIDRRGEVVFCVVRPTGKIITITCEEYPAGVFRIPTGGIGHRENILEAVHREVKEELGLTAEIIDFPGVMKIRFQYGRESVMFYSYLFILRETGGRLLADASDNEISEVREADVQELGQIVENLRDIPGKWKDWGRFRYETSKAVYKYLLNKAADE